jgi:hypothetical protein
MAVNQLEAVMDDTARAESVHLGEYTSPKSDRSAANLVSDIISNAQEIVRSEVRLAKAEIREEMAKFLASAKKMAIAAVVGLFALSFLLWSAAMLLQHVMPAWASTLLVGLGLAVIAAILYFSARAALHFPKPEKTIENVKENVEWVKNQRKS